MSSKRRLTAAQDMATAYHEAGHAVAALYFKGPAAVGAVSIEPAEDYYGVALSKWLLKADDLEIDMTARDRVSIEREIMVSLAGPIAQQAFNPRSVRAYHGWSDRHKAFNLATCVYAGNVKLPFTCSEAFLEWLSLTTLSLVKSRWAEIEALAEELLKRRKMSGKELRQWFKDESKRVSEALRQVRERN